MNGKPWTAADLALLQCRFADSRTEDVAAALGRTYSTVAQKAAKLGLRKSEAYLASPAAHRLDGIKGISTRLQPGNVPWNKGKPGSTGVQQGCRATQFKPGRLPHESRNYLPIGSTRICKDGYLEQKVTDDQSVVPARRWVAVHRLAWEAANGPIPEGHAVVFRHGKKTTEAADITVDRLECITRADLMRRNSYHQFGPEIAKVVQLRGALSRQINKRLKAQP